MFASTRPFTSMPRLKATPKADASWAASAIEAFAAVSFRSICAGVGLLLSAFALSFVVFLVFRPTASEPQSQPEVIASAAGAVATLGWVLGALVAVITGGVGLVRRDRSTPIAVPVVGLLVGLGSIMVAVGVGIYTWAQISSH